MKWEKPRLLASQHAMCTLLLLSLVAGCTSARRPAAVASTFDLSREEMFEALTSHAWCDREFPQPESTWGPDKGYRLETALALYRDGTFLPRHTVDLEWGRTPTAWNFQKTGARSGVLYLGDASEREGRTVLFELLGPDRLKVAGLWAPGPYLAMYGRCAANPPVPGRPDGLSEIARQMALGALEGTAWPRKREQTPLIEERITITSAFGPTKELPDIPSSEAVAALAPTTWKRVSVEASSGNAPSDVRIFADGRTYLNLPPSACRLRRESEARFFKLRNLRGGRCVEEVPYGESYRRSGRFLLFGADPYLPAADVSAERFVFLHFHEGSVEGVLAYEPPLRLTSTVRVELWPRERRGGAIAGTVYVRARRMDGDDVVHHHLGTAVFNRVIPARESVQEYVRLEGPPGLVPVDQLTLEFTHSFAAGGSETIHTFIETLQYHP